VRGRGSRRLGSALAVLVLPAAVLTLDAPPAGATFVGSTYDAMFSHAPNATLVIAKKKLFTLTFLGGLVNNGTFVKVKKNVTFTITTPGSDNGCQLTGLINPTGINTEAAPGAYRCPSGSSGSWYATLVSGGDAAPPPGPGGGGSGGGLSG